MISNDMAKEIADAVLDLMNATREELSGWVEPGTFMPKTTKAHKALVAKIAAALEHGKRRRSSKTVS
jgi:hypothetical protein